MDRILMIHPIEPAWHRELWVLGLPLVASGILFALTSCAGTSLKATGTVCGQQVDLELVDAKDRSGFTMEVSCPGGGSMSIASTDSSTSTVLAQQAAIVSKLTDLVAGMVAKGLTGGVRYERAVRDQARAEVAFRMLNAESPPLMLEQTK
jgi:hypothetical protein